MEHKRRRTFEEFKLQYSKYILRATIKFRSFEFSTDFSNNFLDWLEEASEEDSFINWFENFYKFQSAWNISYYTVFLKNLKIVNFEKIENLLEIKKKMNGKHELVLIPFLLL